MFSQTEEIGMGEEPLRVAVASKDGLSVNQHFGHAKMFWIFLITPRRCEFIEQRHVDNYCHGQTGDSSAMQKILQTINDCEAVFVAKIGDGPIEKLKNIGVLSVEDYAYLGIRDSLLAYAAERAQVIG